MTTKNLFARENIENNISHVHATYSTN